MTRIMDLRAAPGLTEILIGEVMAVEAIQQDPTFPNLNFISPGSYSSQALETISSKRLDMLIQTFRTSFDHIIIDSAPVMLFNDALAIAHLADALLLVIKANDTRIGVVRETIKRMRFAGVNPVGAILSHYSGNKVGGYGYGYGYGYDSYHYYGNYYSDKIVDANDSKDSGEAQS
jgi:tyrosine-protein kinase Etk/Wzc